MRRSFIIILFLISLNDLYSQKNEIQFFDTTSMYYRYIDFNKIDSPTNWTFYIDYRFKARENDSIRPIGNLRFWRKSPVNDEHRKEIYGWLWAPSIEFVVYNISDSIYCKSVSNRTRGISSCDPPTTGGDYLILGNYILLNRFVCVDCDRNYEDYCRPMLNKVFSSVDFGNVEKFDDIIKQFEIIMEIETSR